MPQNRGVNHNEFVRGHLVRPTLKCSSLVSTRSIRHGFHQPFKNLARALPLPAISKPLALTGAGLTHDQRPYPGGDHAVINDTGARYNATQATTALTDVENWFRTHLT